MFGAAAIFAIVYWAVGGAVFPTDDAFINLHNAQVIHDGYDQKYLGVPALVGATSGVHLALLLVIEKVVSSDTIALYLLGAFCGVVYVLGLLFASMNVGCSPLEAALIAIGGLIFAGTLFQLLNGMDTGLSMAAVAWNIKLLTDKRRTLWLSLLCGIMPFIRPELSLFSAGSMFILLLDNDRTSHFKIAACVTSILCTVPFLVWYWVDTGSLVPNTVGAKTYFFADRYADLPSKLLFVSLAMARAAVASFPLFLCARFIRPRSAGIMLAVSAITFIGLYFWKFPSGLSHNGSRYLYIFVPVILFGVACGLTSAARTKTLRLIGISAFFLPLAFGWQLSDYWTHITGNQKSLCDVVRWINQNLPDRPTILVHDAGYVAYAGHVPLVDLVGLKTPAATEFHKRLTYPSVGKLRSKAIADIARSFNTEYLLALEEWNERFDLVDGLREEGWRVEEVYAGIASENTPASDVYHLYRLRKAVSTVGQFGIDRRSGRATLKGTQVLPDLDSLKVEESFDRPEQAGD
ncbi:hypothetical protein XH91_11055 [Bradyrhizobium guangzhouense]|uniref:Uncharacterized protein n=1 Tax=Bradyrhizobium guangzhouense TaxID=1325095 RepID=A0AAE5WZ10_9BRAD|nr:hypothetical protein XH91_11055 [Bradyrhizobium guangzhouense]